MADSPNRMQVHIYIYVYTHDLKADVFSLCRLSENRVCVMFFPIKMVVWGSPQFSQPIAYLLFLGILDVQKGVLHRVDKLVLPPGGPPRIGKLREETWKHLVHFYYHLVI